MLYAKYTWKKGLEIDTRTPIRYLNCEVQTWCSDLMFRLEFRLGNLQSRIEDCRLQILQGSSRCLLSTRQLVNCHDDDLLLNRSLLKTEGAVLNLLPDEQSWRMLGKELIIEFGRSPSLWIFEGISHVSDHGIVTFVLENPFNISRLESRNPGLGEAKQAMAKHVFCMRSTASLKLDGKSAITSVQSGASIAAINVLIRRMNFWRCSFTWVSSANKASHPKAFSKQEAKSCNRWVRPDY